MLAAVPGFLNNKTDSLFVNIMFLKGGKVTIYVKPAMQS